MIPKCWLLFVANVTEWDPSQEVCCPKSKVGRSKANLLSLRAPTVSVRFSVPPVFCFPSSSFFSNFHFIALFYFGPSLNFLMSQKNSPCNHLPLTWMPPPRSVCNLVTSHVCQHGQVLSPCVCDQSQFMIGLITSVIILLKRAAAAGWRAGLWLAERKVPELSWPLATPLCGAWFGYCCWCFRIALESSATCLRGTETLQNWNSPNKHCILLVCRAFFCVRHAVCKLGRRKLFAIAMHFVWWLQTLNASLLNVVGKQTNILQNNNRTKTTTANITKKTPRFCWRPLQRGERELWNCEYLCKCWRF